MNRNPKPILPEIAIERLTHNLRNLSSYCRPGFISVDDVARDGLTVWTLDAFAGSYKLCWWPSRELLSEIDKDVLVLAFRERVRPILPIWKAFEQVDRRLTKLRLKLRVGNLISRARALLPSESELNKVVRRAIAGNAQTQCSLRDMVLDAQKLDELLRTDRRLVIQRCMAQPLVYWIYHIGHPMAKDLDYMVRRFSTAEEFKAWLRRENTRERVRRHRLRKKTSLKGVTPIQPLHEGKASLQ